MTMIILQCETESQPDYLNLSHLPMLRQNWLSKQGVVKFREISQRKG